MFILRKYIIIAPMSVSIVLLVTSCSGTKISQCHQLIKQVNLGNALVDKNKGSEVTTSLQLSKDLEDISNNVQKLNIADTKLKDFQKRFAKIFDTESQNISKASKALSSAKTAELSATGREQVQKAKDDIDTALKVTSGAANDSDIAAGELNSYCGQAQ